MKNSSLLLAMLLVSLLLSTGTAAVNNALITFRVFSPETALELA